LGLATPIFIIIKKFGLDKTPIFGEEVRFLGTPNRIGKQVPHNKNWETA